MASIYDVVTSKEIAAYWNEKSKERKPYLLEAFFPADKKLGLDLSWIKGANKSPVSLMPATFDTKAIPLSRAGFQKLQEEMPYFKNYLPINEKERQELNKVLASGNQAIIDIILKRIFDDKATLMDNASVAREMMRSQLLTTGIISIQENGVSSTFDYGVEDDQKATVDWSTAATADPIGDITDWQDAIEEKTGERPKNLIINRKTFRYIGAADSVKNAVYVFADGKVNVTDNDVKAFIMKQTECTVYIYNKGYTNDSGVWTKFIPDGVAVLAPDKIGNTWFGTTPAESDLLNGTNADVSIVDTGVALYSEKITDPVTLKTYASMICLPSGELTDRIFIASIT